jgi:hypothetical protein
LPDNDGPLICSLFHESIDLLAPNANNKYIIQVFFASMDYSELNGKRLKWSGRSISGQNWRLEYEEKEVVAISSSPLRFSGEGSFDGRHIEIKAKVRPSQPVIFRDSVTKEEICRLNSYMPPSILIMPNGLEYRIDQGWSNPETVLSGNDGRNLLKISFDRTSGFWTAAYIDFLQLDSKDPNPWLLALATIFIAMLNQPPTTI